MREVLLVGGVPLRPASAVFEAVAEHLGSLAKRIPDGEQAGWIQVARRTFAGNGALEEGPRIKLKGDDALGIPTYRLKRGLTASDLTLGPYGYSTNALESYGEFKRLQGEGKIPLETRFQVTMPGPGTSTYNLGLPAYELLPIAREALWREVEDVLKEANASDLTFQFDIAMEAEHEEYLRRPEAFDTPNHKFFNWTQGEMAESVAWLADRVPIQAEVGFHICSIWHHFPDAGQDNEVLVGTANAILSRVTRPVTYVHMPIIPGHSHESDYAPLTELALGPGTRLFLGLINLADGVEGARRRIALAETAVSDFGVSFFCGLGVAHTVAAAGIAGAADQPYENPQLRRAAPATVGEVLGLHREIARL